ncbi:MAG: hypothetical protein LBC51_00635 [Treponema sp.]|jgi:hypothetical protein|nr:hypothetical protein [Treponema sp.]
MALREEQGLRMQEEPRNRCLWDPCGREQEHSERGRADERAEAEEARAKTPEEKRESALELKAAGVGPEQLAEISGPDLATLACL